MDKTIGKDDICSDNESINILLFLFSFLPHNLYKPNQTNEGSQ
jgi:hypothetical protein